MSDNSVALGSYAAVLAAFDRMTEADGTAKNNPQSALIPVDAMSASCVYLRSARRWCPVTRITPMTAQEKLSRKIAAQSAISLKEMAAMLFNDTREGSDIVLSAVLDALMGRLPEAEFINFCDAL